MKIISRTACMIICALIVGSAIPAAAQVGRTLSRPGLPKVSAAWNPNDNRLAFGDNNGNVWIWDAIADSMIATIAAPTGSVASIQWRPGHNEVVYAGYNSINTWNLSNNSIRTLSDNASPVVSVACSPNGAKAACACGFGQTKSFRIWDIDQEKLLMVLDTEYQGSGCGEDFVLWIPDGSGLLADGGCGWEGTIYDPLTGDEKVHLDTWFGPRSIGSTIRSASFSPDGKEMAVGSFGNLINIFDTHTWTIRRQVYENGLGYENVLAWSPVGDLIVVGDRDGMISVWNAKTTFRIHSFKGHSNAVTAVTWSPDGRHVVTASVDGTVKIWDAVGILSSVPDVTPSESAIRVSPVPARDVLHVRIAVPHSTRMTFALVDMLGAAVREFDRDIEAGGEQVNVDLAGIPAGSYLLTARNANGLALRTVVQVTR